MSAGEWERKSRKNTQLNTTYTRSHHVHSDKTLHPSSSSSKPTKTQQATSHDITPECQISVDRSTRLKEAKKRVIIAKTHLDESRNLKTEYKKGIIQDNDNLYSIIKMGIEERKTEGERKSNKNSQ